MRAVKATSQRKPAGRYHHGDLRSALLDVSTALIDEQGAEALTLREVARKLGVSHAAPGHHFADKTSLLALVAARGFDELAHATERAAERAGLDPIERLKATGVAYVKYAAEHPRRFRSMFGAELARCDVVELAEASGRAFDVLLRASRDVLEAKGELDPERLRITATAAWSLVHGLATLYIDDRLQKLGIDGSAALARLAKDITDLVGRALGDA